MDVIIGNDKMQLFVFEQQLWDRAWAQTIADYRAAQTCDEDRETAEFHIEAANAMFQHAWGIFEMLVTPPTGSAS